MVRPPYPAVYRLYAIAEDRWAEIDAAYAQVDLVRQPVHRFLNLVYAWCVAHIDPEKREDWEYQMNAPIPGRETQVSEATAEVEGEGFLAMMQQHQSLTSGG